MESLAKVTQQTVGRASQSSKLTIFFEKGALSCCWRNPHLTSGLGVLLKCENQISPNSNPLLILSVYRPGAGWWEVEEVSRCAGEGPTANCFKKIKDFSHDVVIQHV